MEYEIHNTSEDLYHHGIKGMRWGIRRYQNKDGSLTKAGKKRYQSEMDALKAEEQVLKNRKATKAKLDRLAAKRKAIEDQKKALDGDDKKDSVEEPKPVKKSVKDMGDEELAYNIRRIQMEKQYEALTAEPETVAKGNSFVKDFMNKAVVPAAQEAGKALVRDALMKAGKKYLGLETQNPDEYINKLGKEVKKMTLEKQYKKLKEEFEAEKTKTSEKSDASADRDDNKASSNKQSKTSKTENNVYEGTVEGFGTSSKATNQGRKWTRDSDVIDAEYWEVGNDSNVSSGRSYVSNYMSLPAPKADDD